MCDSGVKKNPACPFSFFDYQNQRYICQQPRDTILPVFLAVFISPVQCVCVCVLLITVYKRLLFGLSSTRPQQATQNGNRQAKKFQITKLKPEGWVNGSLGKVLAINPNNPRIHMVEGKELTLQS